MPESTLRVGDLVSYSFGPRTVRAKVVEDRGGLGVGGRQIVVIEVEETDDGQDPRRFEMPADELTVDNPAAA